MRRVFTRKTLLCTFLFVALFTLALLLAGDFASPLKVRLLELSYIESKIHYASAFLISHCLVLLSAFAALALFQRGREDIALLMRVKRSRLFLLKLMLGTGFMLFMALQLTLLVAFALALMDTEPLNFKDVLVSASGMALYYFALMSVVSITTKSPKTLIVPISAVVIVDTFMPYDAPSETPLITIARMVFPMFGSDGFQGTVSVVSWATLALTGLFYIVAFSIYLEKAHN